MNDLEHRAWAEYHSTLSSAESAFVAAVNAARRRTVQEGLPSDESIAQYNSACTIRRWARFVAKDALRLALDEADKTPA